MRRDKWTWRGNWQTEMSLVNRRRISWIDFANHIVQLFDSNLAKLLLRLLRCECSRLWFQSRLLAESARGNFCLLIEFWLSLLEGKERLAGLWSGRNRKMNFVSDGNYSAKFFRLKREKFSSRTYLFIVSKKNPPSSNHLKLPQAIQEALVILIGE